MLLQLLQKQESADVDIPPGFEKLATEEDDHAKLTVTSSPGLVGPNSSKQISTIEFVSKDIESIVQNIENELHLSVLESCTDFVKIIVDGEVKTLVENYEDERLNEVIFFVR